MPYTFGGAVADDITWPVVQACGGTNNAFLVMGWWYPTTLTAERTLWSVGNVTCAEVASTTSEILLLHDRATTDQDYTTSGAGITIDNWYFLAFLRTSNNTAGAQHRVWRGTVTQAPTELTTAVGTAGSGNVNSNSTFYVGNAGTSTFAFQGSVAGVTILATGNGADAINHPLWISSFTAISQTEADNVRDRLVIPAWQGNLQPTVARCFATNTQTVLSYWSGEPGCQVERLFVGSTTIGDVAPTVSGASESQLAHPRPILSGSMRHGTPTRR